MPSQCPLLMAASQAIVDCRPSGRTPGPRATVDSHAGRPTPHLSRRTDAAERWPARLVGRRLREARHALGATLDEVASAAGFTKSFVSAVERGETSPAIGSLYRICEVLGISMSSLFETIVGARCQRRAPRRRAGHVLRRRRRRQLRALTAQRTARADHRDAHRPGRLAGAPSSGLTPASWSWRPSSRARWSSASATGPTVLQAGDTIAYAPSEPHSWRNPDAATRRSRCSSRSPPSTEPPARAPPRARRRRFGRRANGPRPQVRAAS